ncbi:MAG: ABC transporter [Sphingobacteriaceae bacterium]|nr:ABC transporter [Sphingobacteriaceae bacterium]
MSEEILKALIQLFAIIAKQDTGANSSFRNFVESFLRNQISKDKVNEYLALYDTFLTDKKEKDKESESTSDDASDKPKLTSVKDSVRTLGICKKINKTLVQKQKVVVLSRLFEMINADNQLTQQRLQIINTVAEVFNIHETEKALIQHFVTSKDPYAYESSDLLIMDDQHVVTLNSIAGINHIHSHGLDGYITIIKVQSVGLYFLKYVGESEIFLNGLPIQLNYVYILAPGSTIRLPRGTSYYSEIANTFSTKYDYTKLKFSVNNLEYTFPNGKKALHNVNLEEKSGTLVGIMGASGAGKTTLLNTLCGLEKPSAGIISINGVDVFNNKDLIDGLIGYIAQDDLLFEDLTVYQNLYYNAELCFKDYDQVKLHKLVLQTLNNLGLLEIKDIMVGSPLNKKISGGQRKRLNIALELIREPAVLFVDEPTSGLSSRDSENVMDLLKELSQKGKLIFVVIHQPSSDIFKMFDKLILLDVGGYQIYYGNPVEGVMYFKKATNQLNSDIGECDSCGNVNPELIFNLIESKEIDEYGTFTDKRKFSPLDWNELYNKKQSEKTDYVDSDEVFEKPIPNNTIPSRLKQLIVFLKRDLLSKLANRQYLLINLLEVPALAVLLASLIRYTNKTQNNGEYTFNANENIPAYFFMAILVALLVGLTISAEEIYKDQKILKREKFLKLSRFSYLFSKIVILFTISLIQSLLLCTVGNLILEVPNNFIALYVMVFSVFCSANVIGLILSSTFNSPVTIYIIIPLIIIPQMLLGGAMFRFSKINAFFGGSNHSVPPVSACMVSRWAYEGIMVNEFRNNKYEKDVFVLDKIESNLNFKLSYVLPKIEELKEIRVERDTLLSQKEKTFIDLFVTENLKNEFLQAEKKYGKIVLDKENDSIASLKSVLTEKYNFILNQKDTLIKKLEVKGILKSNYTNKSVEEAVSNSLEKEKIVLDSANLKFVQVIDPIFQDPDSNTMLGLNTYMYSLTKKVGNMLVSTYTYNLIIIWIVNVLGFVLLYFDVLKKSFSISLKRKIKQ